MSKEDSDKPGALHSLVGGIFFTLILLIVVPALCGHFLSGEVDKLVGDASIGSLGSDVLVSLIMWLIIIGFTFALGGGRILKKYGVIGIAGLLVAYYLLGDIWGGVVAVVMLVIISGLIYLVKWKLKKT
ncbi:MAG: hypothetical protein LBG62_04410 [Candidatus Methanoplasma sp.]|jgi:hypothetical protein|nr:hypothetical protein [Candidatus Methanoplasma sp.]